LSGNTFFFYGSLMDRELLEAVLGRKTSDLTFLPGWLAGYAAETAAGYTFPTLVEKRSGRADGVLTRGLKAADLDRIAFFEDTTEYAPVVLDVATAGADVSAQVYVPTTALKTTGERWSFDDWCRNDKPLLLAITQRIMRENYGITPVAEIDAVWHRIKAEIEAQIHAPVPMKAKRPSRTDAAKQAPPRRAARATSPKRRPRGS
jgi:ADP-ribose diphosphatase